MKILTFRLNKKGPFPPRQATAREGKDPLKRMRNLERQIALTLAELEALAGSRLSRLLTFTTSRVTLEMPGFL